MFLPFFPLPSISPYIFPCFPKVLLATPLHPFSLQLCQICGQKCMLWHACAYFHIWLLTWTHSAETRTTQGPIPSWPLWLITFNKANRVQLVWINLFLILVRCAVTSNCQTLCSMKWGSLLPLSGPKLTIASIFYACALVLMAPFAPACSLFFSPFPFPLFSLHCNPFLRSCSTFAYISEVDGHVLASTQSIPVF